MESIKDLKKSITSLVNISKEEHIYLKPGEKPPEGLQAYRGKRGGMYYIGNASTAVAPETSDYKPTGIEVTAINKLKPTIEKFKANLSELISFLPKNHTNNIRVRLVETDDLDDAYGQHEPVSGIISISEEASFISKQEFYFMYNDVNTETTMPGFSHPWKIVFLHELGHHVQYHFQEWTKDAHWEDLTNKNPDGAVTKYATTNHKERFAESYLYYIQNPSELKKRDPEVYNFMYEHIFQGKEFQEALIKQENQLALGSVWEIPGYMDKIKKKLSKDNPITDTINKFVEKAGEFGPAQTAIHNPSRSIKGASGYLPVTVLVHKKDGSVIPSIRWKSFKQENLLKIKSNRNLPAVKTIKETPAFTRRSSVKQTMFFLANEMSIYEIENDNFIPHTNYEFLGDGVYLYSNLDFAKERANTLKREVLPVKVNVDKIYSTKLLQIKTENLDNLKDQGYKGIVLMKDDVYDFDLFCFDNKDITVIGDDNSELSEEIKKSIEDYELQDNDNVVTKQYLETLKCTLLENQDEDIEKGGHPKAAPLKEDGSVDYDSVRAGDSIWVTVTQESSPLKGRPIIITKRPDGLFALTGGSGFDAQAEKTGINTRTEALRHLVMTGSPNKTKADKELDEEQEEAEKVNDPLIQRKKELMSDNKRQLNEFSDKFNEAIHITKTDKNEIKKHKEELVQMATDRGVDENTAKGWATSIVRQNTRSTRQVEEKQKQDVGVKLFKLKQMVEGNLTEEDLEGLNKSLEFKPITVNLPNPENFVGKTDREIDDIVGDVFDEALGDIFNPNPLDKSIDDELAAEGIESDPDEKDPSIITTEIGDTIKPLVIKNEEQLINTFKAYEDYYVTKREIAEVQSKIRTINNAKTTPAMVEKMRMEVRDVLGTNLTDEEINEIQQSYDDRNSCNNSAINFYKAVGEFWNDDNAIRHKLSPIDNSFGGYVNSGATSALAAITGFNLDERVDTSQLIEKTSIEAASLVTAFNLRDKFKNEPEKYDALRNRIEEYNSTNQIKTERRALERHKTLQQRNDTIQEAKRIGLLQPRENDERYKLKTEMVAGEIENLVEQKKNLGSALGSMQASAALLNALDVAKKSEDEGVFLNFGSDMDGARMRLRELNLPLSKATIDDSDLKNIKIATNARSIQKYNKSLEVTKDIHDENERIKSDESDTYTDAEGNVLVNNYDIPNWNASFVDNEGNEVEYKSRVEQRNDINFLKKMDNGLITRTTGAGKTNTALGYFANKIAQDKDYCGVIVVPKNRGGQWFKENKRFTNLTMVEIPENSNADERLRTIANIQPGQIAVISQRDAVNAKTYAALESKFLDGSLKGLVLDEPQEIASKSISGNMSSATRKLMKLESKNRIALTATPASDNLIEAYDLVNWSSHKDKKLGPRTRFQRIYGGYGSSTNAQDTALQQMIFREISPYLSGEKLTNPSFKQSSKD